MTRKTSRRPVQVGKWTPRARSAQRMMKSSVRSNSSTRKGRLSYKNINAHEYKGRDAMFKGRIVTDRKSGVLEFPDIEQFDRIARQEKIPKAEVDKAFGHMRKKPPKSAPKRQTSRRKRGKRRTSRKRRTSKKKSKGRHRRVTSLQRNARKKQISRDRVFAPKTRDGEDMPLRAVSAMVPTQQIGAFGADRGIMATAGAHTLLLPYEEGFGVLDRWLTRKEYQQAFGHLRTGAVLGETERRRPIPTHFGPRSMRLGHRDPVGEGPARPGIAKGQLVLFHKPTGQIVWQAYDDEVNFPDKPIWLWFGANKLHVDFPKAMTGARVGRGDRAVMIGAVDRGIPAMAMLQAFDHLLTPEQRRQAYEVFSQ